MKRHATTLLSTVLAAWFLVAPDASRAADTAEEWAKLRQGIDYRLDVDLLHDTLSPHDVYGDWTTATATLYVKNLPRVTPFVQVGMFERDHTKTGLSLGAYLDWTTRLYSYSAFTTGGSSHYLHRARWDHTFYLNTGPVIAVLGGGYMEDHDGHRDRYVSFGPRWWRGRWIAEYRATWTESDPGSLVSWKHLFSAGTGEEGHSWLFVNLTVGREHYTATWVTPNQPVDHDFWDLSASYQRWLHPRFGVKALLGYVDLGSGIDGYEKVSVGAGAFWEF